MKIPKTYKELPNIEVRIYNNCRIELVATSKPTYLYGGWYGGFYSSNGYSGNVVSSDKVKKYLEFLIKKNERKMDKEINKLYQNKLRLQNYSL